MKQRHAYGTAFIPTQHTPGPWKYGFESIDPEWAIVTDTSGGIVANVNSETGPDASSVPATRKMPRDANARLIAASPELLDLLALALPYVEEAENDPAYKFGAVAKLARDMRALIERIEQ